MGMNPKEREKKEEEIAQRAEERARKQLSDEASSGVMVTRSPRGASVFLLEDFETSAIGDVHRAGLYLETNPPFDTRSLEGQARTSFEAARTVLLRNPQLLFARYGMLACMVYDYQRILEKEARRNSRVRAEYAKVRKVQRKRDLARPEATTENKRRADAWKAHAASKVAHDERAPKKLAAHIRSELVAANAAAESSSVDQRPFPRVPGCETIEKEIRRLRKDRKVVTTLQT